MQLHEGLRVVRQIGMRTVEQTEIVGMSGQMRIQIRQRQPALAVLLKRPGGRLQFAVAAAGGSLTQLAGLFAFVLFESRLVVERIDVRRSAPHAQENDSFRSGGKVRLFRRKRVGVSPFDRGFLGGRLGRQSGEGEITESAGSRLKHLTAREHGGALA